MDFNNNNNNNNNSNNNNQMNNDEKSYIFTTNHIPYRNDNLNYIIKPHLQDFYQQQFIAQQQQQQHQQQKQYTQFSSNNNTNNNNNSLKQQPQNQPAHHLVNILDPFIKDKIILKKKKDGLFSSEQALESVIPPSIIPTSRLYNLLDEINHFYSKEFFIYDRLIIFTSVLMGLSLLTAALFIKTGQDEENGELSAQFLVPMSMSMVFLIFYCVSAFCRYYSCPKHMNEFCSSLSSRYCNLTFKYYKGNWSRGEKIKIEYPRLHINPIVYVYVNENNSSNSNSNLNNNTENNNINNSLNNSNLNNNNNVFNNSSRYEWNKNSNNNNINSINDILN